LKVKLFDYSDAPKRNHQKQIAEVYLRAKSFQTAEQLRDYQGKTDKVKIKSVELFVSSVLLAVCLPRLV